MLSKQGPSAGEPDINFLQWLADTVSEAAKTAEDHQALQSTVENLCAAIEVKFNLLSVQVSHCFTESLLVCLTVLTFRPMLQGSWVDTSKVLKSSTLAG